MDLTVRLNFWQVKRNEKENIGTVVTSARINLTDISPKPRSALNTDFVVVSVSRR